MQLGFRESLVEHFAQRSKLPANARLLINLKRQQARNYSSANKMTQLQPFSCAVLY